MSGIYNKYLASAVFLLTFAAIVLSCASSFAASAPSVTYVGASNLNGNYGAGSTIHITLTWSSGVTVTGSPQLRLNTGRTARYISGGGGNVLTFDYTIQPGDNSSRLDYTSINALALNGGTIKGNGGNALLTLPEPGTTGSLRSNTYIVVDAAAPVITNVTSVMPDGKYTTGNVVVITVIFNENVYASGPLRLFMNTGRAVVFSGGSGSNTLYFNYTVQPEDFSPDFDYADTGSLTLNGGTIGDALGNAAELTLPVPGMPGSLSSNKDIFINAAPSTPVPDTRAFYIMRHKVLTAENSFLVGDNVPLSIKFRIQKSISNPVASIDLDVKKTTGNSSGFILKEIKSGGTLDKRTVSIYKNGALIPASNVSLAIDASGGLRKLNIGITGNFASADVVEIKYRVKISAKNSVFNYGIRKYLSDSGLNNKDLNVYFEIRSWTERGVPETAPYTKDSAGDANERLNFAAGLKIEDPDILE